MSKKSKTSINFFLLSFWKSIIIFTTCVILFSLFPLLSIFLIYFYLLLWIIFNIKSIRFYSRIEGSYLIFVLTSFNMNGLMLSKIKVPTELMTPWKTEPRNPRFLKSRSILSKVRSMSMSWACRPSHRWVLP